METVKYQLDESRIPKAWYNLVSDLPKPPAPPLHPGTHQQVLVTPKTATGSRRVQLIPSWKPTRVLRANYGKKHCDLLRRHGQRVRRKQVQRRETLQDAGPGCISDRLLPPRSGNDGRPECPDRN